MERNRNALLGLVLWISLSVLIWPAQAVTLSLDPATQSVAQGGTAKVDLNISGLGEFAGRIMQIFERAV